MHRLYVSLEDGMRMKTLLCLSAKMVPLNHHLFRKKVILGALSCCKPHISIAPLKNLSNTVVGLSGTPQSHMGERFFQMIKEL